MSGPHASIAAALVDQLAVVDPSVLGSDFEVVDWVAHWDRVVAYAQARQAEGLAELARRPVVVGPDPAVGLAARTRAGSRSREHVDDEVAAALGISRRAADGRVEVARALLATLPGTAAALRAARLDWLRARAMADETVSLGRDARCAVEREVLPGGRRATPARFREAVRRAVLRVDSEAAVARRERARADRHVHIWAGGLDDGWLEAHLPAETAAAIDTALTAAARRVGADRAGGDRAGGETRSIDQLRADLLAAPFLQALRTGVLDGEHPVRLAHLAGTRPQVRLTMIVRPSDPAAPSQPGQPAAPAASGELVAPSQPGELAGLGPISAGLARDLAAHADVQALPPSPPPDSPGYRPSAALARWVRGRDQTCRAPGCARTAEACDLDHTVSWPAGPTAHHNLGPFCRHHHQVKQAPGYRVVQPRPGHFHWTYPTGHTYDVGPDP